MRTNENNTAYTRGQAELSILAGWTAPAARQEVREAAEFITYGHRHIPLEHPAMVSAHRTLQDAGVWSPGDVIRAQPEAPKIEVALVGIFSAGDRHRTLYTILADGIEVGTAVHWTARTMWPWGLTMPAACVVNFGFKTKTDLLHAVEQVIKTGEIA